MNLTPPPIPDSDRETFDQLQAARGRITRELGKVIVGQHEGDYPYYFREFSEKKSYPLGINIVFYSTTH